jgi:predicted RNA binding protein YcfA (HicA-like mRNA interferase family)
MPEIAHWGALLQTAVQSLGSIKLVDPQAIRNDTECDTMNTALKLLQAMRRNPAGDWQMTDLLSLARRHGLSVRSTGGSHHIFSHTQLQHTLTVPTRRPIKAIYIKQFVLLIDALQE